MKIPFSNQWVLDGYPMSNADNLGDPLNAMIKVHTANPLPTRSHPGRFRPEMTPDEVLTRNKGWRTYLEWYYQENNP